MWHIKRVFIAIVCVLGAYGINHAYWEHIDHIKTFLPIPQPVNPTQAHNMVQTIIGQTLTSPAPTQEEAFNQVASLCASTMVIDRPLCEQSRQLAGVPPGKAPSIRCTQTITSGSLQGGVVITVAGNTVVGDPFVTDIVIVNVGHGPQFLDPIWWSGLALQPYSQPVRWTYNSQSSICNQ